MEKDDLFYFGKILGTYGNKGGLMILLDVDDPGKYRKLESVYVDLDHERIPFFIAALELKAGKKVVIWFEDIHTPEDAEPFRGKRLYLPLTMLPRLRGKKFYYHEVTGFHVIDEHHGDIGVIETILELPAQPLFQIRSGQKEILVPATDEIIVRIDRRRKEVRIVAPPGLIELYL